MWVRKMNMILKLTIHIITRLIIDTDAVQIISFEQFFTGIRVFKGCSDSIIQKKQGTRPIFLGVRIIKFERWKTNFSTLKHGENLIQILESEITGERHHILTQNPKTLDLWIISLIKCSTYIFSSDVRHITHTWYMNKNIWCEISWKLEI